MKKDGKVVILAKDAKEKGIYVTAMGKKIEIKKINYFSGNAGEISSVTVLAENSFSPITISGGTELYALEKEETQPLKKEETPSLEKEADIDNSTPNEIHNLTEKQVSNEQITKSSIKKDEVNKMEESENTQNNSAEKKPKQPKMSDIINQMIFDGIGAEKIADAVIAKFPDKYPTGDSEEEKKAFAEKRKDLVQQIKGPRTYNLKTRYPEKFALKVTTPKE